MDITCSPSAFLSDLNPEPGPSDRLIHHTQPCREGRFLVSILFRGGRSPERLRACGHPSWRAQELRAQELRAEELRARELRAQELWTMGRGVLI